MYTQIMYTQVRHFESGNSDNVSTSDIDGPLMDVVNGGVTVESQESSYCCARYNFCGVSVI